MILYRTSKTEETARALAATYPRVLLRAAITLQKPIRFRPKQIQDLKPFIGRTPPAFDSEIKQWEASGGVLIYFRYFVVPDIVAKHDAQLICECPLSPVTLDAMTANTQSVAVIYQPPNWLSHEEDVIARFPPATTCERFLEAVEAGSEDAALCRAVGLPVTGSLCATDEALREILGLTTMAFKIARKATLARKSYSSIIRVAPRIEPEDANLTSAYKWVKDECPTLGAHSLIVNSAMSKHTRYWRTALRALVRCGSVKKICTTGIYYTADALPDWDKIEKTHQAARERLAQIIKTVDELPEFTPDRPEGKASRTPQSAPVST